MSILTRSVQKPLRGDGALSDALLPAVTGNGPFIDLPTCEPLGNPGSFLNINLPLSSIINIRTTSLIAINGNLEDIENQTKVLPEGFSYLEVRLKTPASIILTGSSSSVSNYSVIDVKKGDSWSIINSKNLVAWCGYDIQLKQSSKRKEKSVSCEGTGLLVVNGRHQLFDLELTENEELLINPNSLVASNIEAQELVSFPETSVSRWLRSFSAPKIKLPPTIANPLSRLLSKVSSTYAQSKKTIITSLGLSSQYGNATSLIRNGFESVSKILSLNLEAYIFKRTPIYLSVKGPGKLILNDRCHIPNSKYFTKEEIALLSTKV